MLYDEIKRIGIKGNVQNYTKAKVGKEEYRAGTLGHTYIWNRLIWQKNESQSTQVSMHAQRRKDHVKLA